MRTLVLRKSGLPTSVLTRRPARGPLPLPATLNSKSVRLPVVIHTRDAWADTVDVLRAHWAHIGLPAIMHCFTGDAAQARECLDMGCYLAFGGVSTFPKAADIREAARVTPADRLLLETDAPYLAPVPFRGKRNEPAYVAHTARALAEARGEDVAQLAAATTANFERLFGITRYTENSNF